MKAIRINAASASADDLKIELKDIPKPEVGAGQCLVEIAGSGVNSSDVKGLLGVMPNCVWPRTPGRDYAGTIVEGPAELIGKQVWGSGGDLGMAVNGAHAQYILVGADTVAPAPQNITALERAAIGVPFCTAYIGLIDYCQLQAEQTVAVFGANGSVGKAVIQIALAHGAHAIAVVRPGAQGDTDFGPDVETITADGEDLAAEITGLTGGKGADIAFNTVGAPYFQAGLDALAQMGKQVIINAVEPKQVPFNLFDFYRKQARLIGMASMSSTSLDLGKVLSKLTPLFEAGKLTPFSILPDHIFALSQAADAYRFVLKGETRNRVVIDPHL